MATKNAHILRQWYLKNFTDIWNKNWKIFCYDLEKKKFIDIKWVSTKWLGWRPHTYSRWIKNEKKREDNIEKGFSNVESNITIWIDKIIHILNWIKKPWDMVDRSQIDETYIIELVLLLITKIVWERAINHQLVIDLMKKHVDNISNEEEVIKNLWKEQINKFLSEYDLNNTAKELFSEVLLPPEYVSDFKNMLYQKNWMFSYIKDDNYEFCVSDFPVYIRPSENSLSDFLNDWKMELTFPLSKNILLTIGWWFDKKREYSILTNNEELVAIIKKANQMLIANANRYIAWSKKSTVDSLLLDHSANPYEYNFFSSIPDIIKNISQK